MSRFGQATIIGGIVLALAGCGGGVARDPASEAKAKFLPGRYEVIPSGSVMGFQMPQDKDPGSEPKSICLSSEDASNMPSPFLRKYVMLGEECSFDNYDRKGNAISGKISCAVDPDRAMGKFMINYEGVMTTDTIEVKSKVTLDIKLTEEQTAQNPQAAQGLKALGPLMDNVGIKFTAKRTGDC